MYRLAAVEAYVCRYYGDGDGGNVLGDVVRDIGVWGVDRGIVMVVAEIEQHKA